MEKKISLDIAQQYYYINIPSSAHQAIFNSVFAYDALIRSFNENQDIDLLGYCLFQDGIHLLIYSHTAPSRWLEPCLVNYNNWHQEVSGSAGYLFNDEGLLQVLVQPKFLPKAMKYVHHLPVSKKLCIQADQYLYSSFHDYLETQTTKVKTERILTMLSPHNGQRIRRFHDYMLSQNHEQLENVAQGNNSYYLAYCDSSYLTKVRSGYDTNIKTDKSAELLTLWQKCLVCLAIKTQLDEATLRGIRRHHSLPDAHYLLAWLFVEEAQGPLYFAAKQLEKDEDTLRLNINSVHMHHPSSFLGSIADAWQQVKDQPYETLTAKINTTTTDQAPSPSTEEPKVEEPEALPPSEPADEITDTPNSATETVSEQPQS